MPSLIGKGKTEKYSDNLTLTQIKNMKFPGVTNKTIMEVVNNYGLFTEKYDKVIYSAIDFISKGSYIQIQSDCNRIAIGLQSDSFPTHTRDDKDIKIKDNHHIDAVDDDNSTEKASLEPPSEDMRKEDNSSDVADMEASEKEGACILDIPINSAWSEILMMKSGFSTLLMRNWQFALEVFRQHVIVNCKLDEMQVDGRKRRITLEDISGTADFGNKTDYCFCIDRDDVRKVVTVSVDKVRRKQFGSKGLQAFFVYNKNSGRYYPCSVDENKNVKEIDYYSDKGFWLNNRDLFGNEIKE